MLRRKIITKFRLAALAAIGLSVSMPAIGHAQEQFLGQIMLNGANFCPVGWARTDGQIVAISSNNALFSLFGTMYGGDGRTNFGLPDLRGRSALHVGNGPGVPSTPTQGAKLGSASFVLNQTNLPSHNHAANAAGNIANNQNPQGDLLAGALAYSSAAVGGAFSNSMLDNTGSNQTVNKRSPVQVLEYCVALVGIYPSRN